MANTVTVNCSTISTSQLDNFSLSGNVVCPLFNLGGTLNSVHVDVSGSMAGSIFLSNESFTDSNGGSATVSSLLSFGLLAGFGLTSPAFALSYDSGAVFLDPRQDTTLNRSVSQNGTYGTTTTSLASFTGGGNFSISAFASFVQVNLSGDLDYVTSTSASVTGSVIYDYTPSGGGNSVPEPGAVWSVMTGLAGLTGVAIRRSRRVKG